MRRAPPKKKSMTSDANVARILIVTHTYCN